MRYRFSSGPMKLHMIQQYLTGKHSHRKLKQKCLPLRIFPLFYTWTSGMKTYEKFARAAHEATSINVGLEEVTHPQKHKLDREREEGDDNLSVYFSSPSQMLQRQEAYTHHLYGAFLAKDLEKLRAYWKDNSIQCLLQTL
eukprot:GHVN01020066.1.p1 GENE.GHVN01020066.1~~GHVN01020066.1.p1  ORF type:complete len:140 (+),score=13.56 GHVN01020066.1:299-718(+)